MSKVDSKVGKRTTNPEINLRTKQRNESRRAALQHNDNLLNSIRDLRKAKIEALYKEWADAVAAGKNVDDAKLRRMRDQIDADYERDYARIKPQLIPRRDIRRLQFTLAAAG